MIENPCDPRRGSLGRHHTGSCRAHTLTGVSEPPSAIRQILVLLNQADTRDLTVALATQLARSFASALVVWDAPSKRGDSRASSAEANAPLVGSSSLDITMIDATDDDQGGFLWLAMQTDLTIMGLTMNSAWFDRRDPLHVVQETGLPTLILPPRLPRASIGQRVLVHWTDDRHAERAVRDALPFMRDADMRAAESVIVFEDDRDKRVSGTDVECADCVRFLERHGLEAFPEDFTDVDLRDRIAELGSDLLVMGHAPRGSTVPFFDKARTRLADMPLATLCSG